MIFVSYLCCPIYQSFESPIYILAFLLVLLSINLTIIEQVVVRCVAQGHFDKYIILDVRQSNFCMTPLTTTLCHLR